ncbi:alpha/beta hydrolase family protein [Streptomyces sp. NPDC006332]|uniref:alpha/beta hydrolase n=1 Tax=Streptomyces sp. NPDC006332 TaxID=3155456 RepID=UPI0033BFB0AE
MPSARRMLTGPARLTGRSLLACLLLLTPLYGTAAAAAGNGERQASRSAGTGARITHVDQLDDRTVDLTVRSQAMRASVPVRVILPKSWKSERDRTFPALYMLHGGADDYTSWTRETDVEELADNSEVLVVMPDGGEHGYYSDWYAGRPRWETFHTVELVRLMERSFRANSSRAVVGLSMGGFGALNYAARHPGMFRYVASMSSYVDLDDPTVRFLIRLGSVMEGVDINRVWGDPKRHGDIWQAHNPAAMPGAFLGTKVHLSAGDGTPGPLDEGHTASALWVGSVSEAALPASLTKFAESLRSAGVDVTTNLYEPGTHSWPYWQRELHSIWPTVTQELS